MQFKNIIAAFNAASREAKNLAPITKQCLVDFDGPFSQTLEVPGFPGVTVRREFKVSSIETVRGGYEDEPQEIPRYVAGNDIVRICFGEESEELEQEINHLICSAPWDGWIHSSLGHHLNRPYDNEVIISFANAGREHDYAPVNRPTPPDFDAFADDVDEVLVFGRELKPATKAALKAQTATTVDMIEARHGFDAILRNIGLEGGAV